MPHKLRCRDEQCLYLSTVFALAERPACGTLRDGILTAAVEHLLSLDVEIRWQDIADVAADERDEMGSTDDDEDIFELEGMSDLDIRDGSDEAGGAYGSSCDEAGFGGLGRVAAAAAAEASTSGRQATDEMADTLDSLMELTFEHLTRRHAMGNASEVWACLLSLFERLVLPTARCKFTQFLVFGSAALGPPCRSESLIALLLSRATSTTGVPDMARCIAAAYLGSFLARAAFVPSGTVLSALTQLLAFCKKYASTAAAAPAAVSTPRASTTPMNSMPRLLVGGDAASARTSPQVLQPHAVFYACVQAAMYVLCYRLCPGTAEGAAQLIQSLLLPLLLGPLDPLRHVLPSVSAEFAHQVSSAHGLDTATGSELAAAAVAAAAAARSGSTVSSTAGVASGISGSRSCRPLDVFFPFDPYLLSRSARLLSLRETYISWRHGHPLLRQAARPPADATASSRAASLGGSGGGNARPPHRHGDDDGCGEDDQDGGESMAGGVDGGSLVDPDGASAGEGTSASGSSGDELEGMSLRSGDHHLLMRPGQRGAGHGHAPACRPPLAPGAAPALAPVLARLQRHCGSSAGVAKHMRVPHGVSPDDSMALFCSPGGMSPVDTTPMGASPVLVSYMGRAAGSPMQMTPVDGGHMERHVAVLQRAPSN
uniref:RNA polymerase I-specific transcription initiation factor RRN3 n=1 Tax=Chlamydomonas euryale TaxID=1486919 RepID=A0A7R9VSW0_9CHLO